MEKMLQAKFFGNVQGVGLRYTAKATAEEMAIVGWIKNLSDGSVELEAQGEEKILEQFLEKIQKDFAEFIKNVELAWCENTDKLQNFEIR